jgi:peptide/nickel transport system ATP-binding protein
MPSLDPDHRTTAPPLAGDPPNPIDPPAGCRFHPRCALAAPVCSQRAPLPVMGQAAHGVACLAHEAGSGHPQAVPPPHSLASARRTGPVSTW